MAFMDEEQLAGFFDRPELQPEHDRSSMDAFEKQYATLLVKPAKRISAALSV